jgi:hypothetical protein
LANPRSNGLRLSCGYYRSAARDRSWGSAAIYITPEKVDDSAFVLNDILEWSAQKHSDCVEKGFKNLCRFTREKFTAHYLAAYNDVLKEQTKF